MHKFDLVIRNGLIYDGRGLPPFIGDVGVVGDKIAQIGQGLATGKEEIDATGLAVTPGFVDVHTHYDGQLTWWNEVKPSSGHGVTTVVVGNCGVGFAPCRPEDRSRLISLLEGVEDMPEVVLTAGLAWDWTTFPDYVAAVEKRPHDIDYAVQLPHSALRVYVMGERAVHREVATEDDLSAMRRIAAEAIEAGAFGFGTSRSILHKSMDGRIIPTAHAPATELLAIAKGMEDAGGGSIQALLDLETPMQDFDAFYDVARSTKSPLSISLVQFSNDRDDWKDLLARIEDANKEGVVRVTGQVFPRPVGVLLGLETSFNPFSAFKSYQRIAHLPLEQRVLEMRKPEIRAEILADGPEEKAAVGFSYARQYEAIYPLGVPPVYEPAASLNLVAQAETRGISPDEIAYDIMLQDDGHGLLMMAIANYENKSLDEIHTMLVHPNTVPGLGDGGAHYGMISDSTYTTFLLTYWGRDRPRQRIPVEQIVHLLTQKAAESVGMCDRGVLEPGLSASINVIDLDQLRLREPRIVYDLPAGGRRLSQEAEGYVATIVSGRVIMRDGRPTGELPGRLVRRAACSRSETASAAGILATS